MGTTPPEADVIAHEPAPRRSPRLATAVGLVAVGVLAGAAFGLSSGATAQTATPSDRPGQSTQGDEPKERKGGPGHRAHKLRGAAIHGEFVVKASDGTFRTMLSQRGTVTTVSATSITVLSEDGYLKTYVVNADTKVNRDGTISEIATGDTVGVMATKSGDTATANHIHERKARPAGA